MANKDTVKPWFVTRAYPTQAQFWQLFDWLRWRDEQLAITDISGLQNILNNTATINNVKALFREEINLSTDDVHTVLADTIITGLVIESATSTTIKVGTTTNGDDIAEIEVQAGERLGVALMFASNTDRQFFFTGITGQTKIIIIKNPQ